MQSIALVNAKLCMWERKALHVGTQSFAYGNAKLCIESIFYGLLYACKFQKDKLKVI